MLYCVVNHDVFIPVSWYCIYCVTIVVLFFISSSQICYRWKVLKKIGAGAFGMLLLMLGLNETLPI